MMKHKSSIDRIQSALKIRDLCYFMQFFDFQLLFIDLKTSLKIEIRKPVGGGIKTVFR